MASQPAGCPCQGDASKSESTALSLDRLELGLKGDAKPVGEGVSELRIDYGPGYRVYFVERGQELIILLAGGDKRTQAIDIKKAIELARGL